jgi:hypothetical protein
MLRELQGLAGARLAVTAARAPQPTSAAAQPLHWAVVIYAGGLRPRRRSAGSPCVLGVEEGSGQGGPEVFDGQGKRSVESAHFPPQGLVWHAQGER